MDDIGGLGKFFEKKINYPKCDSQQEEAYEEHGHGQKRFPVWRYAS
jgi:hypothetical protein